LTARKFVMGVSVTTWPPLSVPELGFKGDGSAIVGSDRIHAERQRVGHVSCHTAGIQRLDNSAAIDRKRQDAARIAALGGIVVTVAVKVTDWPKPDGFGDEVSAVVVSTLLTVCTQVVDVLAFKLPSPP